MVFGLRLPLLAAVISLTACQTAKEPLSIYEGPGFSPIVETIATGAQVTPLSASVDDKYPDSIFWVQIEQGFVSSQYLFCGGKSLADLPQGEDGVTEFERLLEAEERLVCTVID